MTENELREHLAAYAHEAWSGWMRYMFDKCEVAESTRGDRYTEIPQWAVERWQRQMNTEFSALPNAEKQSDYEEADRILSILSAFKKETR